ncbi:MAG TPA: class I SAM-dependent methyltransferase [Pyrinomonadaceae bacterium]|nr:class I SAM-dependent methyltransferase [Pyrinomonadaceae bacterium]
MSKAGKETGIAAAYDRWAGTYDSDPNRTRELAAEVLRRAELPTAERDIVEIGCGTGANTEWLATQAASITALDFSEKMLRRAATRLEDAKARFLQHDVRSTWPLADNAADVIVAMLILEHIEHLEPVFAEAARVLRPSGTLFICELHPMRQLMGGQAQFSNTQTGERERVPAFLHDVSDFVNGALAAGFELNRLDEWRDRDAELDSFPRLLSLLLVNST